MKAETPKVPVASKDLTPDLEPPSASPAKKAKKNQHQPSGTAGPTVVKELPKEELPEIDLHITPAKESPLAGVRRLHTRKR